MKLYIGNKTYSSWSFRVWMTLRMHDIEFEEDLRPFDVENNYADFFEFSPTGKVPVLVDGDVRIWESLAILEFVAEKHGNKSLWPADPARRAHARSAAHEMHAGFLELRAACPMNMRRRIEAISVSDAVRKDVRRIETLWSECLTRWGGPFLYGKTFSAADGMYAPIVNRLQVYELSQHEAVKRYTEVITQLPPWRAWTEAARVEPWTVDIDEIYERTPTHPSGERT